MASETGSSHGVSHASVAVLRHQDQKPHMEKGMTWLLVLESTAAEELGRQAWWQVQEAGRVNRKGREASPSRVSTAFQTAPPAGDPRFRYASLWRHSSSKPTPLLNVQTQAEMPAGRSLSSRGKQDKIPSTPPAPSLLSPASPVWDCALNSWVCSQGG